MVKWGHEKELYGNFDPLSPKVSRRLGKFIFWKKTIYLTNFFVLQRSLVHSPFLPASPCSAGTVESTSNWLCKTSSPLFLFFSKHKINPKPANQNDLINAEGERPVQPIFPILFVQLFLGGLCRINTDLLT